MAGSRSLGSLTLDLILKLGGFTAGLDKAGRDLDKLNKRAYAFGQSLGKAIKVASLAAFATAAAGVTIAVHEMFNAIDRADSFRDLSIQTGLSVEALSKFAYAGKQTGVSIDELSLSFKFLAKNAELALNPKSKQADIFKALLGDNYQTSLGDLQTLIPKLANAFQALPDGITKTSLSLQLLGKSGNQLTEFFNLGSQGLDEYGNKLETLGGVITTNAANSADAFKDKLDDLKTVFGGLALQVAEKMLPALINLVDRLKDLASNSDIAADAAHLIGSAMSFAVGLIENYTKAVAQASITIEGFIRTASGLDEITSNLITFGIANGTLAEGADKVRQSVNDEQSALADLQNQAAKPIKLIFAGVDADPAGLFKKSIAEVAAEGKSKELQDKLNAALAGSNRAPSIGRSRAIGGSSGKSDAQRQAEQLQSSYDQMVASLNKQIALTGEVSDVEKLRYDLANGELAKLSPVQKEQLVQLQQSAQLRQDDYDGLQKQIQAEEDHNAAVKQGIEQTAGQIQDMQFELDLLQLTDKERAKATALRYADVNATQAQRDAIGQLSDAYYEMSQQKQFLDDLKAGLSGMFVDFVSGAKSAKDAFGDFADAIYARALQFVADKAIQALFDGFSKTGTSSTGSTGGFLSSLVGLFGGQRAMGGPVKSGQLYEVGEYNRPETFFSGGKQFLIPGNQGMVSPSGGISQSNNFYFAAPTSMKTQEQLAARVGTRATEAIRRNN